MLLDGNLEVDAAVLAVGAGVVRMVAFSQEGGFGVERTAAAQRRVGKLGEVRVHVQVVDAQGLLLSKGAGRRASA